MIVFIQMALFLDNKAAAAAIIDNSSSIERLPNVYSIFSAEVHELHHFHRFKVSPSG